VEVSAGVRSAAGAGTRASSLCGPQASCLRVWRTATVGRKLGAAETLRREKRQAGSHGWKPAVRTGKDACVPAPAARCRLPAVFFLEKEEVHR